MPRLDTIKTEVEDEQGNSKEPPSDRKWGTNEWSTSGFLPSPHKYDLDSSDSSDSLDSALQEELRNLSLSKAKEVAEQEQACSSDLRSSATVEAPVDGWPVFGSGLSGEDHDKSTADETVEWLKDDYEPPADSTVATAEEAAEEEEPETLDDTQPFSQTSTSTDDVHPLLLLETLTGAGVLPEGTQLENTLSASQFSSSFPREVGPPGTTALVYDAAMTQHEAPHAHPECPQRIVTIQEQLKADGLLKPDRAAIVPSKFVTLDQIKLVHTEKHCDTTTEFSDYENRELCQMAKRYNSVFLNEHTTNCALLAAGSVVNVVEQVVTGKHRNGACIVRPPGHHAEAARCMGFCILNNIAIAAALARKQYGLNKVLILDWDVHHGNGTQEIFEKDPNVLFMSLHRYDFGQFYPGESGTCTAVGTGPGEGFNVNVGWNNGDDSDDSDIDDDVDVSDADYYHAFQKVIMPIARQFEPDLVLVSAGFDAAEGDPLGECHLSERCFARMTEDLMGLAGGRIVLCLEGGYNLQSTATSFAECIKVLQGQRCPSWEGTDPEDASVNAKREIENARKIQSKYWNV